MPLARPPGRLLQHNPTAPFHRFEEVQGRPSLRYATADLMRPSCVNCHNTHPASPKTDWQTGDVRGVLEVIFPLDTAVAQTRAGLRGTFALMVVMSVLGLSGLALVIGRLRRNSADLDQRARRLEQRNRRAPAGGGRLAGERGKIPPYYQCRRRCHYLPR